MKLWLAIPSDGYTDYPEHAKAFTTEAFAETFSEATPVPETLKDTADFWYVVGPVEVEA